MWGAQYAHTFLDGYFSMKKGVWRSDIFLLFLIQYKLSEIKKKIVFFIVFWLIPFGEKAIHRFCIENQKNNDKQN